MGNRYFLAYKCLRCNHVNENVYYAPTCGVTTHKCPCGLVVDLGTVTGISHEEASNRGVVECACQEAGKKEWKGKRR